MKHISTFIASVLFESAPASLKIIGNSMYPYLKDGQHLTIIPLLKKPLQFGKCYVYQSNGKLIVHRLIWNFNRWAYFAGDANCSIEKIETSDIIGEPVLKDNEIISLLVLVVNGFFLLFHKNPAIFSIRSFVLKCIFKPGVQNEKIVSKTCRIFRTINNRFT